MLPTPFGTIADEEEFGGHVLDDACENFDDIVQAFNGAKIGNVDDDALVVLREPLAQLRHVEAPMDRAVQKIRDHADLRRALQLLGRSGRRGGRD